MKFLKNFGAVMLASAIIGTATCCYVNAGLGGDSVAVFNDGLSRTLNCSLGTASWILNVVLLVTAFFLAKEHVAWTTALSCLMVSVFIDLANWVFAPVFALSGILAVRWILFASGLVLVSGGCALMIRLCPGMSVMDAIASRLAEIFRCSFRLVRVVIDGMMMLTGWLMGGVVGAASIVAVLGTGPLIQFFVQLKVKK